AGGTREQLGTLAAAAPEWRPAAEADAFLRAGDLVGEPDVEVDWQVDGLLPTAGTSIIAAKPKAGKSTTARCAGVSVARGASFLSRSTKAAPVLYLAHEGR